MGFTVQREGFITATSLLSSLTQDLAANGFNVLHVNGSSNPPFDLTGDITQVFLEATDSVDPLAGSSDQPWRLVLEAFSQVGDDGDGNISYLYKDGHRNWIRAYVCCPEQIIVDEGTGNWRVAYKRFEDSSIVTGGVGNRTTTTTLIHRIAGMISTDSNRIFFRQVNEPNPGPEGQPKPSTKNGFFYCFNEDGAQDADNLVTNDPNWGKSGDFQAHPLSYRLVISDHGIAFALWGESYDDLGRELAWFCTQRMVDKDSGAIIVDGKAPLCTVFSLYGNGSANLNSADPLQIQYMITREADVNTPTFPISAVTDTADSRRIINAVQQVAIGEDKNFIVSFPNELGTQRYGYPHELDMIAYTSADAVSQENEITMRFFNEGTDRVYTALGSNNTYNKGMRILFQVEGVGIDVAR